MVSSRGNVFPFHSDSGLSSPDARSPTSASGVSASGVTDRACLLGRLLLEGSSVVVRSLPSSRRGRPSSSSSGAPSVYRRVRHGLVRVSRLRPHIRLVVSRCLSLAVFLAIRGFLHLLWGRSVSLFTDNTSALSYLLKEGDTCSSTLNSVAQEIHRLCESN